MFDLITSLNFDLGYLSGFSIKSIFPFCSLTIPTNLSKALPDDRTFIATSMPSSSDFDFFTKINHSSCQNQR